MKILHISGANGWGGNEQQIITIIPELNKMGVINIVLGIENSELSKRCSINNIDFLNVKGSKLNKYINYKYLKFLTEDIKPDLIHLHTSDSLTFYTVSDILFKLKIKTIFSKKGMGASGSFLSKFKYNYPGITSIFCVSKTVEKDFAKILTFKNKTKTTVIHDSVAINILNSVGDVNLREKYRIDKKHFIIGNIANHSRAKDIKSFINVVDYLVNDLNRKDVVFFQIGGFSKLSNEYFEFLKGKNLDGKIIFTDKIKDAYSLNPQFDLFLLTSQREGGPTSVLEAMLIGVPIVSTNVGVIPEAITDGENGFISSVKDYKDLAIKIELLLNDIELKDKFIKNSKLKILSEFVTTTIAKQTKSEYEKVLLL